MRRSLTFRMLLLTAGVLFAYATTIRAQDVDDQQRGVARISLMNGEVSVQRGDAAEWVAGVINAPLLTGDRVSTAPNSRAEIQFDSANLLRIGGNAEIHLAQLESGRYQIELAHGTVTYVVLRPSTAAVEVDTPNVSVRPSKQGIYRITVNEAGESEVIARSGEVEVFTPRGSQWVNVGQMMQARGTQADPEFQIVSARPLDDWDRWNQNRDRVLMQSTSTQYVPQGVYGAEDLDSYGSWVDVPTYGHVWRPTVAVGWAPYRSGRWVWEDWYGWTWVSYDPWGWAPYHYGRWFYDGGLGWCWYPGLLGRHHYWSPALVGWFGYGPGVGIGFGFGHVGWVPLAPYETFHPWWGRGFYGRGFNERINIANVNVTNVYRNARVGGVSGISAGDFQGGRFHNIAGVAPSHIGQAGLIRGQVPLTPTTSHLAFSSRSAAFVPRTSPTNTRFFSHQQVTAPQRMPFSQQQRAFNGGGVNAPARTMTQGSIAPAQRGAFGSQTGQPAPAVNRGTPSNGNPAGGWRRFGEAGGQGTAPQQNAPQRGGNTGGGSTRPPTASPSPAPQNRGGGGWQRFGSPGAAPRQQQPPQQPPQAAPRSDFRGGSGFGSPRYNAPLGPQAVRERPSAPAPRSYNPPPQRSYSPPAPRSSSPQAAPHYSAPAAPRGGGGGGGASRPSGGGGGGSHSSGGGHGRG